MAITTAFRASSSCAPACLGDESGGPTAARPPMPRVPFDLTPIKRPSERAPQNGLHDGRTGVVRLPSGPTRTLERTLA